MNDTENNTEDDTENNTRTRMKRSSFINKRTPEEILSEISFLQERYPDRNLIDQCFKAISSTRKSNRISESKKLNILQEWDNYPVNQVMAAIRIFLKKGCSNIKGKPEQYLNGIIRNNSEQKIPAETTGNKTMKRTGSMLDKYYQEQGYTLT